jgi:hypothetical protein
MSGKDEAKSPPATQDFVNLGIAAAIRGTPDLNTARRRRPIFKVGPEAERENLWVDHLLSYRRAASLSGSSGITMTG